MVGGGLTYYNITAPDSLNTFTFTNANGSCNNFVCNQTTVGEKRISFADNITVNGTLTLAGSSGNKRVEFIGAVVITPSLVTAAAISLTDVDFRDITAAGAAIPWTGTRFGDEGGNTNITFTAPKTVYWNQVAGGNWFDVAWAASSGGAVASTNQPLPQDTAIFDDTGINAGSTITFASTVNSISAIDASGLTNAITINTSAATTLNAYGSQYWSSAVTLSGSTTFTYYRGAGLPDGQIDAANATITAPLQFSGFETTQLISNLTTSSTAIFGGFNGFTLDLNDYVFTCSTLTRSPIYSTSIAFGTGSINITGSGTTVWSFADLTGFSYTGTPTVNFTYSGSTGTRTVNNGATAGATESNVVDFNITAGTDTFAPSTGASVRNLNFTGYSGTASIISSGFIYGNLTLSATQTVSPSSSFTNFAATSGIKTITTNGVTIDRPIIFNGVGGTWELQDALTLGSTRSIGFYAGTFTTNGYTVTCGKFGSVGSLATGNRTINLGSSVINCIGYSTTSSSWQVEDGSYTFTVNAGTSTIYMSETYTGASTQNFIGGGKTYHNLVYTQGQPSTISGNNTFNSISNTFQPISISFEAGSTQTVGFFSLSGTSGNLVTLNSGIPGTQFNLVNPTGMNANVSYCSITDSAASPNGYWYAFTANGNVDGGNNTGWVFSGNAPTGNGFLMFFN
jgi:hypothetical protein